MPIIAFLERYYPVFVDFRKSAWFGEFAADQGSIENAAKLYVKAWDLPQKEKFCSEMIDMLADPDLVEELATDEVMRLCAKTWDVWKMSADDIRRLSVAVNDPSALPGR